ncbi:hypothetical protein BZA05DRAFT_447638 [Tricharina praecox]|uniref:uncharacterized protein n=1 Tax=Tricharina praecox TaxID=43433 RepID=UPI00221FEF0E|nr:uncharacterized protein BZA05DRAFT_449775 [Tricharina praecox]XP_051336531.1 uncharacterized protein BZA05DRAFT_447638 [Tricharina praecox]KAI5840882.1 hypothetical protein BZA05DRAFT_449775 [Tricharina praecox]KAI5845897.1 hypothetical protein BZA05DRAFT_447638 [Tricharina praecox]
MAHPATNNDSPTTSTTSTTPSTRVSIFPNFGPTFPSSRSSIFPKLRPNPSDEAAETAALKPESRPPQPDLTDNNVLLAMLYMQDKVWYSKIYAEVDDATKEEMESIYDRVMNDPATPAELKSYALALAKLWGVLPTNFVMAVTKPPFQIAICKIQTITQALEELSLGDGSSMPLTTGGNTANKNSQAAPSSSEPTFPATSNNINDNPFLFPRRSWGNGSGASALASSSTNIAPHCPSTIDAPIISGDSTINIPSPHTSGKGTPVSPAFHPHLEGVYYASPDPAIPPVVYQNICISLEWADLSMEELRIADYEAGWKFPDQKWR